MFNNASSQVIIVFHTDCSIIDRSIIDRSIIRRSIKSRMYVLTHLLIVVSLFCLSMFCRTSHALGHTYQQCKKLNFTKTEKIDHSNRLP